MCISSFYENFCRLPPEITDHIFTYCNSGQIRRLRLVCRHFRSAVDSFINSDYPSLLYQNWLDLIQAVDTIFKKHLDQPLGLVSPRPAIVLQEAILLHHHLHQGFNFKQLTLHSSFQAGPKIFTPEKLDFYRRLLTIVTKHELLSLTKDLEEDFIDALSEVPNISNYVNLKLADYHDTLSFSAEKLVVMQTLFNRCVQKAAVTLCGYICLHPKVVAFPANAPSVYLHVHISSYRYPNWQEQIAALQTDYPGCSLPDSFTQQGLLPAVHFIGRSDSSCVSLRFNQWRVKLICHKSYLQDPKVPPEFFHPVRFKYMFEIILYQSNNHYWFLFQSKTNSKKKTPSDELNMLGKQWRNLDYLEIAYTQSLPLAIPKKNSKKH